MPDKDVYAMIKRMRELSKAGVPFGFSFVSCNLTDGISNGSKTVTKAILRTGFSPDKSDKHRSLIGYKDLDNNKHGWFYIPLLLDLKLL